MKTENLQKYLESFGRYVVQQSRTRLTKGNKNVGKGLYNSLKFDVISDADGFSVQFFMADYGAFIDKGVSGTQQARSYTDYKGKKVKTPYKYSFKQPPRGVIDKWIVKKGIAPRDEKGQFTTRKSLAFLIARSIKRKGIQGISFFQRPLQLALENFSDEVLNAIKEDITEAITIDK